jgi:hypothetical protein
MMGPARDVFFDKLAMNLGLGKKQLETSFKEAAKSTIDQATQNGYLTAAQAGRLKEKVERGREDFFHQSWAWVIQRRRRMNLILATAANRFGMSVSDLEDQLESGKSLADLAREKGIPEDDLRQAMVNAVKPHLGEAVKAGKITPKFAEVVIQRIEGTEAMPKAA